jgi:hypothetical protein
MANGALPCNVNWWVADAVTMTTSQFQGTILAGAAITATGGTYVGLALARAAVTLTSVAATRCGALSNMIDDIIVNINAIATAGSVAPSLGTASGFAVLSAAPGGGGAVTLTGSTLTGDVGSSGSPASIVQTSSTVTGAIVAPVPAEVLSDFNISYNALETVSCDQVLTGTLASVSLAPGVYCFDAAATVTGTLTLGGPSTGIFIFKIGTSGTGALTGTNFQVVVANGALPCNVYWWVADAVTMTTSQFKGTILAGAAISLTGGTFVGLGALGYAGVTFSGVYASRCGG